MLTKRRSLALTLAAMAAVATATVVALPAPRASAQQAVTVVVDSELDGYGTVTAGPFHGSSVSLSATVGQQLRFRVDPGSIQLRNTWNDGTTCWVFGFWKWRPLGYGADSYQEVPGGQETDFVVPASGVDQTSVEVTAAYRATGETWKYPACWDV